MRYFSDNNIGVANLVVDIKGLNSIAKPLVGDVLKVFFSKKGSYFVLKVFVIAHYGKIFVYLTQG